MLLLLFLGRGLVYGEEGALAAAQGALRLPPAVLTGRGPVSGCAELVRSEAPLEPVFYATELLSELSGVVGQGLPDLLLEVLEDLEGRVWIGRRRRPFLGDHVGRESRRGVADLLRLGEEGARVLSFGSPLLLCGHVVQVAERRVLLVSLSVILLVIL